MIETKGRGRFVKVWRITADFHRVPAGRFVLCEGDTEARAESVDARSRRFLENLAREGAVDFDLRRYYPSDGVAFLKALRGHLTFSTKGKASHVQSWGLREGLWTASLFPLMWVQPQLDFASCHFRSRSRGRGGRGRGRRGNQGDRNRRDRR